MLRILLPVIMYLIGYVVTHYAIIELKNKEEIFKSLTLIITIILIAFSAYTAVTSYNDTLTIIALLLFSLIIFYFTLPNLVINDYVEFFFFSLLGLLLGVLYLNQLILFLACALLYFKSTLDYLTKKLWYDLGIRLASLIILALISAIINSPLLAIISCAGLLRVLRR
ncbi:MAG: hypothetical protein JW791_04770 [Nanoarchaeota archaeon]|nr:hypothetical protein [Nanoarchaeota archaeon]